MAPSHAMQSSSTGSFHHAMKRARKPVLAGLVGFSEAGVSTVVGMELGIFAPIVVIGVEYSEQPPRRVAHLTMAEAN
jgi:hypothetical protein